MSRPFSNTLQGSPISNTNLNGLPRSWDSFVQGIYARKKLVKFSILWEECSQEETRIAAREEKMGSEDQALMVHSSQPKEDLITPEVRTLTKITLENICLGSYVIHVLKQDIMQ